MHKNGYKGSCVHAEYTGCSYAYPEKPPFTYKQTAEEKMEDTCLRIMRVMFGGFNKLCICNGPPATVDSQWDTSLPELDNHFNSNNSLIIRWNPRLYLVLILEASPWAMNSCGITSMGILLLIFAESPPLKLIVKLPAKQDPNFTSAQGIGVFLESNITYNTKHGTIDGTIEELSVLHGCFQGFPMMNWGAHLFQA